MEILLETLTDTYLLLPMLLVMYMVLEYVHQKEKTASISRALQGVGPLVGALVGIIPQCGFSVLAASLYMQGSVSIGTLLSVFIATSDEMVPLFLTQPEKYDVLLSLLLGKVILAIVVGYVVDILVKQKYRKQGVGKYTCTHTHGSIVKQAMYRTITIYAFLFITTYVVALGLTTLGEQRVHAFLLQDSVLQPLLTSIFGFIPNCASSVILTQLYMQDTLAYASLFAGLVTNAGLGFLTLLKYKEARKDIIRIACILLITALISSYLLLLWV